MISFQIYGMKISMLIESIGKITNVKTFFGNRQKFKTGQKKELTLVVAEGQNEFSINE